MKPILVGGGKLGEVRSLVKAELLHPIVRGRGGRTPTPGKVRDINFDLTLCEILTSKGKERVSLGDFVRLVKTRPALAKNKLRPGAQTIADALGDSTLVHAIQHFIKENCLGKRKARSPVTRPTEAEYLEIKARVLAT